MTRDQGKHRVSIFQLFLLFSVIGFVVACSSTQPVEVNDSNQDPGTLPTRVEPSSSPVRASINVRLTARQKRTLDMSLPPKVRDILENADEFEILAEVENKDGKLVYPVKEEFKPNTKVEISKPELVKELLEDFYTDVSRGESPSDCWFPHHILKAKQGDKTVEIEICFSCSRFVGKSSLGEFSGTFAHGNDPKSEAVFNRIVEKYGVSIQ